METQAGRAGHPNMLHGLTCEDDATNLIIYPIIITAEEASRFVADGMNIKTS